MFNIYNTFLTDFQVISFWLKGPANQVSEVVVQHVFKLKTIVFEAVRACQKAYIQTKNIHMRASLANTAVHITKAQKKKKKT